MQAAEQPDQQDDRNWNTDQPEKKSASHVILQKVFLGRSHNPFRSALGPEPTRAPSSDGQPARRCRVPRCACFAAVSASASGEMAGAFNTAPSGAKCEP